MAWLLMLNEQDKRLPKAVRLSAKLGAMVDVHVQRLRHNDDELNAQTRRMRSDPKEPASGKPTLPRLVQNAQRDEQSGL